MRAPQRKVELPGRRKNCSGSISSFLARTVSAHATCQANLTATDEFIGCPRRQAASRGTSVGGLPGRRKKPGGHALTLHIGLHFVTAAVQYHREDVHLEGPAVKRAATLSDFLASTHAEVSTPSANAPAGISETPSASRCLALAESTRRGYPGSDRARSSGAADQRPLAFHADPLTVFASRRAAGASSLIPIWRVTSSTPTTMCPPPEFAIARTSFANSTRSRLLVRSSVSLKSRFAVSHGESRRLMRRSRLSSAATRGD